MEYMSLKDVAIQLKLSYPTVHKYVKSKQLRAVRVGSQWRVTRDDFEDFINKTSNRSKVEDIRSSPQLFDAEEVL